MAGLLRAGLNHSRADFIELSQEVEFIENYLKIEIQRFPNRYRYKIEIDDRLNDDMELPPLMIQTICENVIKHAYTDYKIDINLRFKYRNESSIEVIIEDNGRGYYNTIGEKNRYPNSSLGLEILKQRIELLKTNYDFTDFNIQPLDPATNIGTVVTLILPLE